MRPLLRYLSCFFVLICAAYGIYTFVRPATSSAPPPVRRDTLIIRDTLRLSRPVPVREEVVRYVTVRVAADSSNLANIGKDSADVLIDDTAKMVMLPITQKMYRDSSYTAWVSGYAAALDSIEVYPRTLIVRQTAPPAAKPRRWSVGVQGGYGLTPKGLQPYVGVGVGFRIF